MTDILDMVLTTYDASSTFIEIAPSYSSTVTVLPGKVSYLCPYCGAVNFRKRFLRKVKCVKCGRTFEVKDP